MHRYALRDDQWAKIKDFLAGREGHVGGTAADNRLFVDAVIYRYRTGIPWRDLPERYGAWKPTHKRYLRWCESGVFARIFEMLASDCDNEYMMLDATILRAHQHSVGAQKKDGQDQAIGRSRGGLTAKVHAVVANAVIEKTEAEEDEISRYSMQRPGFRGELEFDLTFSFLGKTATRKAKVVYTHTPKWEYWDLRKNAPYTGWSGSSYHIELAAVPEDWDGDGTPIEGTPHWVEMEDILRNHVLPYEMWDAVLDAIDERCKVEDAERRRIAAARATSPARPSRRRH